jgi:tetratricopeptide (TPR) repeat protein
MWKLLLILFLTVRLQAADLLTYDSTGALRSVSAAVARQPGYLLVNRSALLGAASAAVLAPDSALYPLLYISGDDPDAGVAEIFVGYQAPQGPPPAPEIGKTVRCDGATAQVRYTRESGSFGWIARLQFPEQVHPQPGALFDEHGRLLGWHTVKTVDGERMHFGIPLARFDSIHASQRLSLAEWNAAQDLGGEEDHQRALGHLWAEDFDGARYYFSKAVEARPTHARAWLHLGFVEGKTGHTRRSIECYETAIRHDPTLAPAYYYLGFTLVMAGQGERARALNAKLEKLDPALAQRLRAFIGLSHVDVLEKDPARPGALRPKH